VLLLETLDDDAVVERTKLHFFPPASASCRDMGWPLLALK
jgi:hypothetical protein